MFHPSADFAFVPALQRAWRQIRDEYEALPLDEFVAWPERALCRGGWDVYGLHLNGARLVDNCVYCPHTTGLIERHVPGLANAGFSRLAPGSRIAPHVGYTKAVLRLHLTLKNDGDGALRVGSEQRRWIEGECLLFDDMVEHEAWNHGPGERVVLLIDFARPVRRSGGLAR